MKPGKRQPTNLGIHVHELTLRGTQAPPTRQDTSLDEDDLGISPAVPCVEPGAPYQKPSELDARTKNYRHLSADHGRSWTNDLRPQSRSP